MIKNNKGFILVETLIVTVFVVTLFVLIYKISVPTIGEYEQLVKYEDVDSIYYANLYKHMLTHYGNLSSIDNYLESQKYIDITDCDNDSIYTSSKYCHLIQNTLNINNENSIILLTKYDIREFKNVVNSNVFFDSGVLSNFRKYIKTVPNMESSNLFGDIDGKYRLFIVRTVLESDKSVGKRYVNLGIYSGTNKKIMQGDIVYFDPDNNGKRKFYSLFNSPSTSETVTLILAENLKSNSCFNSDQSSNTEPDILLNELKNLTNSWTKAIPFDNYIYKHSSNKYEIDYSNYYARLLEDDDLLNIIGCKEDGAICFDKENPFEVAIQLNENEKLNYLFDNLDSNSGYWTASTIKGTELFAWSIKNNKIAPSRLDDCTNIGIRPVIVANKSDVVGDDL